MTPRRRLPLLPRPLGASVIRQRFGIRSIQRLRGAEASAPARPCPPCRGPANRFERPIQPSHHFGRSHDSGPARVPLHGRAGGSRAARGRRHWQPPSAHRAVVLALEGGSRPAGRPMPRPGPGSRRAHIQTRLRVGHGPLAPSPTAATAATATTTRNPVKPVASPLASRRHPPGPPTRHASGLSSCCPGAGGPAVCQPKARDQSAQTDPRLLAQGPCAGRRGLARESVARLVCLISNRNGL